MVVNLSGYSSLRFFVLQYWKAQSGYRVRFSLHIDPGQFGDDCFNDDIGGNHSPEAPCQYPFPPAYRCVDMEVGPVGIRCDGGHPDYFPAPCEGFEMLVRGKAEIFWPRNNLAGLERPHEPDIATVYLVVLKELHQGQD